MKNDLMASTTLSGDLQRAKKKVEEDISSEFTSCFSCENTFHTETGHLTVEKLLEAKRKIEEAAPFGFMGLGGIRVVIVPDAVLNVERTWKQRLFSLPWKPWRKYYKRKDPMIADGESWRHGGVLYVNQRTFNIIRNRLTLDAA